MGVLNEKMCNKNDKNNIFILITFSGALSLTINKVYIHLSTFKNYIRIKTLII